MVARLQRTSKFDFAVLYAHFRSLCEKIAHSEVGRVFCRGCGAAESNLSLHFSEKRCTANQKGRVSGRGGGRSSPA
jgi:hypothetical protein